MASITYSGRLAQMEIPASSVPASRDFTAIADARGRPMIFAIGTDSTFRLIIEDGELNRKLVNLSEALGLYTAETVHSYAVNQDNESNVYLAISTKMTNMMTPGRLFILKPFESEKAGNLDAESVAKLVIPAKENLPHVAERILLGHKDTLDPYPLLAISFKTTLDSLKQDDIKRINITEGMSSWSLANDLQLPTQIDKTLDIIPATVASAKGIFVLYEVSGRRAILFTAYTRKFSNAIECPPGAARIATFVNLRGKEDLIIAGNGLWHVPSSQLGRSGATPISLVNTPAFQEIRDLDISRLSTTNGTDEAAKESLSIWALNGEGLLSYLYIDQTQRMDESKAIRVVPEGKACYFSSFIDVMGNQSVIYSNPEGNLCLLEQPAETCLWDATPLIFDDDSSSKAISCYYVPISVTDKKTGLAVPNARLRIHGTCWMNIFSADRTYFIKPSGTWIDTDMEGKVSLMMPTQDIACSGLTIKEVLTNARPTATVDLANEVFRSPTDHDATRGNPAEEALPLDGGEVIIDPTYHTMNVLGALGSVEDLKSARTPFGDPVFAGQDIKEDELKAAGGALKHLKTERQRLLGQPVDQSQAKVGTVLKARPSTPMPSASDLILHPIAWIHYAEEKIEEAADWVIEKLEEGWSFIVRVAGKAWQFVLDTVEAISKGIKWVWENVLKKPLSDLMDYLGFELARHAKDIVRTKRLISGVLNSTFDLAVRKAGDLADYIDENMAVAEKRMHEALDNPKAAKLQEQNVNQKSKAEEARKKEPTPVDTAISWIRDRLTSSAKKQAKKGNRPTKGDKSLVESLTDIGGSACDIIMNAFENLEEILLKVLVSILSIFASERDKDISIGDLFHQAFADIIIGIVKTTGKLVSDVIRLVATILQELRNILNTPLDVLMFGSLLGDWLGISLPSIVDIVCFIVAVPATIIRKIASSGDSAKKSSITGLPESFTDKQIEDAFTGKLAKERPAEASSFMAMCYDIEVALVPILAIVDLGMIGYSAITAGSGFVGPAALRKVSGGGGFAFKVLLLIATAPYDMKVPAWEARVFLSALGLGNAIAELVIHLIVKAPAKLKAAATIDFAVAAISLAVIPSITAAEIEAQEQEWIGKTTESLSYTKCISSACTLVGKFGTNGAVLTVEPTSVLAAAGVGALMNSISAFMKTATYSETLEGRAFKVVDTAGRK